MPDIVLTQLDVEDLQEGYTINVPVADTEIEVAISSDDVDQDALETITGGGSVTIDLADGTFVVSAESEGDPA